MSRAFAGGGARARGEAPRPGLVLTAILASSLAFVDGSVVNVGLPSIGRALQGDAAGLQWVVDAYLLPLSALVLFGGALGDRAGRRRILAVGTVLFAAASAACAAASSLGWLVAARAIQGVGAAFPLHTRQVAAFFTRQVADEASLTARRPT